MPHMPELPVEVPKDQRQIDGVKYDEPIHSTHHGQKRTALTQGDLPVSGERPGTFARYEEDL